VNASRQRPPSSSDDPILRAARQLFGFSSLRPGQREAIDSVLAGADTLAVLATGSGKSAIYELAGQLLAGPTVVISPLIALQRDQLAALEARGRVVAIAVNSTETSRERQQVLDRLVVGEGRPDFVFLAPEQLADGDVLDRLAQLHPVLLAVDEAHLVSRWGPDFRPDYLRIGPAVEAMGRPIVLALTATAAPTVRAEIVQRLGMRDPAVKVCDFHRPNIDLAVHSYFTGEDHKLEVLGHDVVDAARQRGHGIVYGATHKRVENLAAAWSDSGLRVAAYHAGLGNAARTEVEHRFHDGELDVVVATIAFGMGIDKPDIRWVFHADVSGSPDEYYQEVGRAGRDGDRADAVLYFRSEDLRLPHSYAAKIGPSEASLTAVADALAVGRQHPLTLADLQERLRLSRSHTEATALALADVGGVTVEADGRVMVIGEIEEAATKAAELVRERRAIERTRVDTMEAYAEHLGCRWAFLLEYFGEAAAPRCGHCDNDGRAQAADSDVVESPFPRGSRVRHHVFGEGVVVGYVGSLILLEFDRAGYKRLDLGLVMDGGLLQPSE
jgi:ATP-dependent DNA helicase RecQ